MNTSIESIDEIPKHTYDSSKKVADYFGFSRQLIIEQKALTVDQSEKVQSIVDAYENEEFFPRFYGQRDLDSVLKHFPNREEVKKKIYNQITKVLEGYLSQASRQIKSTAKIFGTKNSCGMVIVLNDQVNILNPEVVVRRIQQRLHERRENGTNRFGNIIFVLYICETHLLNGHIPCTFLIYGCDAEKYPKHRQYIDYLVTSWSYYSGGEVLHRKPEDAFTGLEEKDEPIPNRITRSKQSEVRYLKNPYMRLWTDEEVLESAATYVKSITPYFLKGGPNLPGQELGERALLFTDYVLEMNYRSLDLRELTRTVRGLEK